MLLDLRMKITTGNHKSELLVEHQTELMSNQGANSMKQHCSTDRTNSSDEASTTAHVPSVPGVLWYSNATRHVKSTRVCGMVQESSNNTLFGLLSNGCTQSNMARLFDVLYVMSTHQRRKHRVTMQTHSQNLLLLLLLLWLGGV